MGKIRKKAVEHREARTEEQEELELAQLRLRWRAADAENERILQEARRKKAKKEEEAAAKEAAETKRISEADAKRFAAGNQRQSRIKFREDEWLKKIYQQKKEIKRGEERKRERREEFLTQ